MKKLICCILTTGMLIAACVGCSTKGGSSQSSQSSSSGGTGKELKIGLSVMDLSNSYFAEFSNGAQKYADENGIKLIINDPQSDT